MAELIDSFYQITLLKDSSYQTEFEVAKDGILKSAWETKFLDKSRSLLTNPKEMMNLVVTGDFVMYDSYSAIKALKEYQECKITTIGFFVSKVEFAFALPKGSPYRQLFNDVLRRMEESGDLMRIRKQNSGGDPQCVVDQHGHPIGIENLMFPISIFILGLFISLLLLALELILHKCCPESINLLGKVEQKGKNLLALVWLNTLVIASGMSFLIILMYY